MQTEVTNQIQEQPPVQPALPIAWPKDAKDVRDFFHADFITAQFAAADQTPCNEDRYLISAHDFLSAVNWWANFPHVSRTPQTAPLPLLMRDIARDHGITALEACQALKDLGNFSVNTAVTAEMAAKLRELFPVPQAAPAAVAVSDERAAFEAWAKSEDMSIGSDCDGYIHANTAAASQAWQARAALAATPAAVQTHAEAAAALGINSALTRIRAGNHAEAIAPLEHALRALAATPAADAPAVPKWIDDPHDIEQGQMLNPEWVRQQQPAIMPKGESAAAQLRAMATNYPTGHSWDKLDAKACIRGALEIEALRALLAQAAIAAAPAHPAEGVQAVEQGEVLVTVSGFTGCGKSAIAGEIEILCRALGLQVQWPDGDSEKNMTHADWTEALEQYKPRVRIVEQNIPFASKKGLSK